jgi:hypothetical protein
VKRGVEGGAGATVTGEAWTRIRLARGGGARAPGATTRGVDA